MADRQVKLAERVLNQLIETRRETVASSWLGAGSEVTRTKLIQIQAAISAIQEAIRHEALLPDDIASMTNQVD